MARGGQLDFEGAKESLGKVNLQSVRLGGFLIVLRDDFDVTISGEPFVAYILLLNLQSGLYLARIWNQTVASGYVSRVVVEKFVSRYQNGFTFSKSVEFDSILCYNLWLQVVTSCEMHAFWDQVRAGRLMWS